MALYAPLNYFKSNLSARSFFLSRSFFCSHIIPRRFSFRLEPCFFLFFFVEENWAGTWSYIVVRNKICFGGRSFSSIIVISATFEFFLSLNFNLIPAREQFLPFQFEHWKNRSWRRIFPTFPNFPLFISLFSLLSHTRHSLTFVICKICDIKFNWAGGDKANES